MAPRPGPATHIAALVVFEDRPDSRWLRPLRAGFRHCFCLVRAGDGWILCDSRASGLHIMPAPAVGVEPLARSYAALGATVVGLAGPLRPAAARGFPPAPFTCVEVVRRLLGLGGRPVLTPHGLFRRLLADPRRVLLARARS